MATWDFTQFHSVVSKGKLDPVYCFIGDETYLVDQAMTLLKKIVVTEGLSDFNYNLYYSDDVDMGDVKAQVETLPMMTEKRLVVLKEAHILKADQLEQLVEIVSVPTESTVFAVFFQKIDQRKKIFKDLLKTTTVIEINSPKDRDLPMWVNQIAKSYQKKLSPPASNVLIQYVGGRLVDLDNEIRKLSLYVGEAETIDIPDIEAVVSRSKIDSVFQFTEAIGAGKSEKALFYLKNLIEQGESEVGLLAMISRHIRLLVFAKEGLANVGHQQLSSYVGVPPFFLNQYVNQANVWSTQKLKKVYGLLLKTDRQLKSVSLPPQLLLEKFVTDVNG